MKHRGVIEAIIPLSLLMVPDAASAQDAPTDEFGGHISASIGNYGLFDIRGALNIPITDTLAVRLAGQSVKRSGFTSNLFNDKALDDQNFHVARAYVRWEPLDGFRNDLIVSTMRADENGRREKGLARGAGVGPVQRLGLLWRLFEHPAQL